jgi:AbrB family looped-hinge helix DNA binding protein
MDYDNVSPQGGNHMAIQKLSSKNRIVIPNEAQQAMDVKGGDQLLVVVNNNLTIVMPKAKRYARTLQAWPRQRIRQAT